MDARDQLIKTIRWQQAGFNALASPFYAALADELVADVERSGPTWQLLAPFAECSFEDAYVLRLLGGVHRLVLRGDTPALSRHFPSTGGDGDAAGAMTHVRELLGERPTEVLEALTHPPQTNEVGRAAALASGLLVITDRVHLPLRLRELGASGGLNLRLDRYWYEHGGRGWGVADSPVRFVDLWRGGAPPFRASPQIVDRRGCDRDPIDITTDEGALLLLSYIWPEPAERFVRARHAIAIARDTEAQVERGDAAAWLKTELAPLPGTAIVVGHSVVWQYLDAATRAAVRDLIFHAGARATPDAPVAWLRLEPTPERYVPAELRLNLWDGHRDEPERLLATTGFHGGLINWQPG